MNSAIGTFQVILLEQMVNVFKFILQINIVLNQSTPYTSKYRAF